MTTSLATPKNRALVSAASFLSARESDESCARSAKLSAIRTSLSPVINALLAASARDASVTHEIERGNYAIDRLSHYGEVPGRLWQHFVQPKSHVTFEDAEFLQALRWQAPQTIARPLEKKGIDRIHLEERIFPFNQSIESRAGALRNVKKNDRFYFSLVCGRHRLRPSCLHA
jgi:hypothetical protein